MKLDVLRMKIAKEDDLEKLREFAQLLTKLIGGDMLGRGYCVVDDKEN